MTTTLAQELRSATKEWHHVIDHHPMISQLAKKDITEEQYRRILQTFAWIYDPLQRHLVDVQFRLGLLGEYRISPRQDWLADDLEYFGIELGQSRHPLKDWRQPTIDSAAKLVGTLYVVEGSTLGGQVLMRCLTDSLGVTPVEGGRFFSGHGEATMAHWANLWKLAEKVCPIYDWDAACSAAREMFAVIARQLTVADAYWRSIDARQSAVRFSNEGLYAQAA